MCVGGEGGGRMCVYERQRYMFSEIKLVEVLESSQSQNAHPSNYLYSHTDTCTH